MHNHIMIKLLSYCKVWMYCVFALWNTPQCLFKLHKWRKTTARFEACSCTLLAVTFACKVSTSRNTLASTVWYAPGPMRANETTIRTLTLHLSQFLTPPQSSRAEKQPRSTLSPVSTHRAVCLASLSARHPCLFTPPFALFMLFCISSRVSVSIWSMSAHTPSNQAS